ncbi:sensor histidine kinase [Elusimicrobiota bacterium]
MSSIKSKILFLVLACIISQAVIIALMFGFDAVRRHQEFEFAGMASELDKLRQMNTSFEDLSRKAVIARDSGSTGDLEMAKIEIDELLSDTGLLITFRAREEKALKRYHDEIQNLKDYFLLYKNSLDMDHEDFKMSEEAISRRLIMLLMDKTVSVNEFQAKMRAWSFARNWIFAGGAVMSLLVLSLLSYYWVTDISRAFTGLEAAAGYFSHAALGSSSAQGLGRYASYAPWWNLAQIKQGHRQAKALMKRTDEIGRIVSILEILKHKTEILRAQIMSSTKLTAMGEIAAGVAHEINNPLVGVLGQSEMLLSKLGPEHKLRPNAQRVFNAAQRCRQTVKSLLDFAGSQKSEEENIGLEEAWDSSIDLIKNSLDESNIKIIKEIGPGITKITARRIEIKEALLNLILNAKDAMPKGGILRFALSLDHNWIKASVVDSGIGISKEHLPRIFDAFFTTKPVGHGKGLGLSAVYGTVRKIGGKIRATSEGPDEGTAITMWLPAASSLPSPLRERAG